MSLVVLQHLFYIVIGIAIVAYVMLDGFDLGVGCLHLFGRNDYERRINLNSIGPIWDGNEVWLIIIAGGLFAGFPDVYASLFSGFYLLWMSVLAGIMFRAVAIEFRSKTESAVWRQCWDCVFSLSSVVLAFLIGVVMGNLIQGVPVNEEREIVIAFGELFTLFPIILGVFSVFLLTLHGHLFLLLKTEGDMQNYLRGFLPYTLLFFSIMYIVMTVYTLIAHLHMTDKMMEYPLLCLVPLGLLLSIVVMWFTSLKNRYAWAFVFSCLTIALLFLTVAIGLYPALVFSSLDNIHSLTLYNASSQALTLKIALLIVVIGVPLVLAYGALIYFLFRHKTKLHEHSY